MRNPPDLSYPFLACLRLLAKSLYERSARPQCLSALQLFSLSALLFTAPALSGQTIVALAPTGVTLDSLNEASGSEATNLTNQSGLSSSYTSGTTTFSTAIGATHSNDSNTRWVSSGDTLGSIIFDCLLYTSPSPRDRG